MNYLSNYKNQNFLQLCFLICFVTFLSCSSSTEAEAELYQDGIHVDIIDLMGEEMIDYFENDLDITIHRGDNPPYFEPIPETSKIFDVESNRHVSVNAEDNLAETIDPYWIRYGYLKHSDANKEYWFNWPDNNKFTFDIYLHIYDHDVETNEIEVRKWLPDPFFYDRFHDDENYGSEDVGSALNAKIHGDENHFTIIGDIRMESVKHNIDFENPNPELVETEVLNHYYIFFVFSGTLASPGIIESAELGMIMQTDSDQPDLLVDWPENTGISMGAYTNQNDQTLTTRAFRLDWIIPW